MKRAQAQTNAVPKRTGHLFKWNIYSKLRNPFFILEYYYFCPRIPTYPVFFNIFFTRWFLIWKFQKQKWREMQIPFLQQTGKCEECSLSPFTRYAYWYSSRPTQSWQTAWVWKFKVWLPRDFPASPGVKSLPSCAGVWVRSLVRELGSPCLSAKKKSIKQKQYCNKFNKEFKKLEKKIKCSYIKCNRFTRYQELCE